MGTAASWRSRGWGSCSGGSAAMSSSLIGHRMGGQRRVVLASSSPEVTAHSACQRSRGAPAWARWNVAVAAATRPQRRAPGENHLEGVQPLVPALVHLPVLLPDPDRLAVPARPGVVEAASHPPLHLQDQAASSFTGPLRQTGGAGLAPDPGYMAPRGAPQHVEKIPADDRLFGVRGDGLRVRLAHMISGRGVGPSGRSPVEECFFSGSRKPLTSTNVVGEGGLEPPHPFGHRNLNPARLPIPPLARGAPKGGDPL